MLKLPSEIKKIKPLNKGKRSIVYEGKYRHIKVAIKTKNPKSKAIARMENEARYLRLLNKHKIGPKLILKGKNFIIYKLVEGEQYYNIIKKANKKLRLNLTLKILDKCRTMDILKINKLEFTRPVKHCFVKNKKVTMIDFERCYKSKNPKNVTQFCNFLLSEKKFGINKKKMIRILKDYKKNQINSNYKKIKKLIENS